MYHVVSIITFKRQYPKLFFPGSTQEEPGGQSDAVPAPRLVDSINPLNWIRVARAIRKEQPDLLIFKYWLPFFGPCFGTIAGPLSPPLSITSGVSRLRPPLVVVLQWQERQLSLRNGSTSRSKLTGSVRLRSAIGIGVLPAAFAPRVAAKKMASE